MKNKKIKLENSRRSWKTLLSVGPGKKYKIINVRPTFIPEYTFGPEQICISKH